MKDNISLDDLTFRIFKNVIIAQNRVLLKAIADKKQLNYEDLLAKYLKAAYYLPVILPKPINK